MYASFLCALLLTVIWVCLSSVSWIFNVETNYFYLMAPGGETDHVGMRGDRTLEYLVRQLAWVVRLQVRKTQTRHNCGERR